METHGTVAELARLNGVVGVGRWRQRLVGRNFGLTGPRYVAYILIPSALPSILSGLKVGWAFAWRTLAFSKPAPCDAGGCNVDPLGGRCSLMPLALFPHLTAAQPTSTCKPLISLLH